jgi:hypothetical protein
MSVYRAALPTELALHAMSRSERVLKASAATTRCATRTLPSSVTTPATLFYRMLLRQVARVGLKVEYGQRVERYFEDEAANVVSQSGWP